VVYSGGAMARWRGAVGFLLRFLQKRRNLDMKGRWRRERGRRGGETRVCEGLKAEEEWLRCGGWTATGELTLSSCPSGDDDKGEKKGGEGVRAKVGWAALERKERRIGRAREGEEPKERGRGFGLFRKTFYL
jgi:hypothetical protein